MGQIHGNQFERGGPAIGLAGERGKIDGYTGTYWVVPKLTGKRAAMGLRAAMGS